MNGQSQQVDVGDLSMGDDRLGCEDLQNADIISPEVMARGLTKPAEDVKNNRRFPWPVGIVRVAGNADKAIFGKRTGGLGLLPLLHEPAMRHLMMNMHGISQSQKQIDIQKVGGHDDSSRRRLTRSRVTTPASGWTGNCGRPCLLATGVRWVKAWRARSESTRPSVKPCCLAISLAARRTSSSRSTVVRIVYSKRRRLNVPL